MRTRGISKSRKAKEKLFGVICLGAILSVSLLLFILLFTLVKDGLRSLDWHFLTSMPSRRPERAGILTALAGSLWIAGLTLVIAVPLGLAAAIYLEEFAARKNRVIDFIQLNIANLAGVPSIVYGLLGLALFVRWMALGRSVIAGGLTMTLLILPMVILVSQEALRAVPRSYRDASFALGATRWQTIRRQVLPSALPGILTGVILSLSRAVGETAPLITIGAVTYINSVPGALGDKFTVLPIQIYEWVSRPQQGFHDIAASAILVLLVLLLTMNSLAIFLRQRAQKPRH